MIIIDNSRMRTTFYELELRDTFFYNGNLYMVMEEVDNAAGDSVNCVCLYTGGVEYIDDNVTVEKVKCTVQLG